jgi:hypothetical protein
MTWMNRVANTKAADELEGLSTLLEMIGQNNILLIISTQNLYSFRAASYWLSTENL